MKRIQEEINDLHNDYSFKINVLLVINSVNWENLAVDDVVCVSSDLNSFCKGGVKKRHFCNVYDSKFICFDYGKSSKTAQDSEKINYNYALPEVEYNKLITSL